MKKSFGWARGATVGIAVFVTVAAGQASPPATAPVVLFDEGHAQQFHAKGDGPLDLSRLAKLVTARGGVAKVTSAVFEPSLFRGATALVLSGAFQPLTEAEVASVVGWVEKGGQLCVMIHIEPPQSALLHRFGVSVSNVPVTEASGIIGKDPLNFSVTRLRPNPLTRSVKAFNVYGAWALLPTRPDAEVVAETSSQAWVDLNRNGRLELRDAKQSFAVAVAGRQGKGRFFVLGDDAALQNRSLSGGNLRFGENLVDWLLRRDTPAQLPGFVRSHETSQGTGSRAPLQ